MLRAPNADVVREKPRRNIAEALGSVEADVRSALAGWPASANGTRQSVSVARFTAGPDGALVQLTGRWPSHTAFRPAGAASVDGRLVYAIGDVHGCYRLLMELLARLGADASSRAANRPPVVVLLGDYVDRGPDSARVLEALSLLRTHAPFELCLLKGNHEQALLQFLDQPEQGAAWIRHGGDATLRSYGVEPPPLDARAQDYCTARDQLLKRMPAAHLRLLQTLDLMAVIGGYAFVHAGVSPGEPLRRQRERDLLWIRREFLEARRPADKVVVHGHTWVGDKATVSPGRIGLDTGAYETGVLSAIRIADEGLEHLHVRDLTRPRWRDPSEPAPWSPVAQPLDFTSAPTCGIVPSLERDAVAAPSTARREAMSTRALVSERALARI